MQFYKLTAEQRAKLEALNEMRTGTLLIICDHGDGNIGVEVDHIKDPKFSAYLNEIGGSVDNGKVTTISFDARGSIDRTP